MFADEETVAEVSRKIQKALLDITHNQGTVVIIETLIVNINSARGGGATVNVEAR